MRFNNITCEVDENFNITYFLVDYILVSGTVRKTKMDAKLMPKGIQIVSMAPVIEPDLDDVLLLVTYIQDLEVKTIKIKSKDELYNLSKREN